MEAETRILGSLNCPNCQTQIAGFEIYGNPPVATSFDACLRKCTNCGRVGASNTSNPLDVTFIFKNPLDSIPIESRAGAESAIKGALNERNRPSKWTRFGFFPTSEDAITWVVFTYLLRSGRLIPALRVAGLIEPDAEGVTPTLLLWGVPIDSVSHGSVIREQLRSLAQMLGERANSLSEPDVIIDLGSHGLIFIEVKHRSGNDFKKPDYAGWTKYLAMPSAGWSPDKVKATGLYELARNWCLVKGIAANRTAILVNLGPPTLFQGDEGRRLNRFIDGLGGTDKARFKRLTWAELLSDCLTDAPDWFSRFVREWRVI